MMVPLTDKVLGTRLKKRRQVKNISLSELSRKIGVSVGQILKYENGANRISAITLYGISEALETPIADFFAADDDPSSSENDGFSPRVVVGGK